MFARYKKDGAKSHLGAASPAQSLAQKPAFTPIKALGISAPPKTPTAPVATSPEDRERKRKDRLSDIKLELHKRLLDDLNLAALETASEADLRAEIVAISSEALEEMSVVLTREDRITLYQDLYDEVMGLGPLEPLLKDDEVNDILVNGPHRVFVERTGRLELTNITFKDVIGAFDHSEYHQKLLAYNDVN